MAGNTRRTKERKIETHHISHMIGENSSTWQCNSTEIDKIKSDQNIITVYYICDGVILIMRDKIWIPTDRVKELIERTHKNCATLE